jgi:hypothetical protein
MLMILQSSIRYCQKGRSGPRRSVHVRDAIDAQSEIVRAMNKVMRTLEAEATLHQIFSARRRAKPGNEGLDEFCMLVVGIICPPADDEDKVLHPNGILNDQDNCEVHWLFMIGTSSDRSLTPITNAWENWVIVASSI